MASKARKQGFQMMPHSPGAASNTVCSNQTVDVAVPAVDKRLSLKRTVTPCVVNNVSAHGWLERMRNLSPPRFKTNPLDKTDSDTDDVHYRAWLAKHPSAFDEFHKITEAATAGKRIVVFLDYDGTLSPIVEDPERAFMTDEMRHAVKGIATLFPTAIITGRSRDKVFEFVRLPELYYAGSHGMDIMGPANSTNGFRARGTKAVDEKGNEIVLFQPASEFVLVMDEVFKLLEERIKKVYGAKIEHNKFCITVHFRCVKEEYWLPLAEQVQHVISSFPKLHLSQGRKVLEVRPSIAWNKGKAIKYLLKTLGPENRNDIFPIYIGDDRTDEDAFKVVNRRKLGLGILVSNTVKETNAGCSLRDTTEVLEFLRNLVRWKRRRLSWMA